MYPRTKWIKMKNELFTSRPLKAIVLHTEIAAWLSGNGVANINKVTLRRARLVLGWVTVSGFNFRCGMWPDIQINSTWPSASWVGAMSANQRAVTPCGWKVKAGMVRVWVAGKTVWSPCYARAISEPFRDKTLIKRYINSAVYFYFYIQTNIQPDRCHRRVPRHYHAASQMVITSYSST